jgi:hypothetical protein
LVRAAAGATRAAIADATEAGVICRQCRGTNVHPTGEVRFSRSTIWARVEMACRDCHHAFFSVARSVQHVADDLRRAMRSPIRWDWVECFKAFNPATCKHEGIGLPGCGRCDQDRRRVAAARRWAMDSSAASM